MEVSYLKMWLKDLIKEEINKDQLKSVALAVGKSEEYLRHWILKTDPTPNQSFSVWLLRGLKKQWIRMEDGHRARQVLEKFIKLRRQNRIGDIMKFPHISDLEGEISKIQGATEQGKKVVGLDPLTLPGVSILEERPQQGITLYKVSDAKSLSIMGEGTKWCTRYSYKESIHTAQSYISKHGYLVVGFKDGKPFIQFNPDYSQVMDVNDVSFKSNKEINPKDLELPEPEFLKKGLPPKSKSNNIKMIRPVEPKRSSTDPLTSQQRQLLNWMSFTHKTDPNWNDFIKPQSNKVRTMSTKGRDLDYERRLANSILKTDNHEFFSRMMYGFSDYAETELGHGVRSPIVEKALLDKNFADIQQNFGLTFKGAVGKDGNRKMIREKRVGINGLVYICRYVKNNIGGHWPEFEKKLQNDPYNSVYYYNFTELDPIYVTDPLLKKVILVNKDITNQNPESLTEDYNATIRDIIVRTRAVWKHGTFSMVIQNILLPFLKTTNQTVQDVLGDKLAQLVAKSYYVGRNTRYWKLKDDL